MSAARQFCRHQAPGVSGLLFALLALLGARTWAEEKVGPSPGDHWAFKPAVRPTVPVVTNRLWPRNPIDNFVLARLESEKLVPSTEADRVTLIRRLSFDLTGLPPTPEEVGQFVFDGLANAYERLVDRLLASPRYGERWARHWLDVVHYGESHGYDKDKPRPNAWPYRDYLIGSFNQDKPYSRFVEEQLAGDVLFPGSADGVVATGFIVAGPWDYVGHVELPESKSDGLIARYNDRDDMVMNSLSTFLSLTVHCARCHDHKFNPISQEEYYRLQAVFAGVDRADRTVDRDPQVSAQRRRLVGEKKKLARRQRDLNKIVAGVTSPQTEQLNARLKELKEQFKALAGSPEAAGSLARQTDLKTETEKLEDLLKIAVQELLDPATRSELAEVRDRLSLVTGKIESLPKPQIVFAATSDFDPSGSFLPPEGPRPIHLLKRGDVKRPGPVVSPGALKCVPGPDGELEISNPEEEGLRRAALARWITDRRNMLTRRSIVNRIWQYHFGRGIVDTPNDFGHMGSLPTHPELLDWLAYWFLDNGESLKKLHRLMVTSATYRQTSNVEALKRSTVEAEHTFPAAARVNASTLQPFNGSTAQLSNDDADNRLLSRRDRQQLDAESFRDALLFLSDKLDLTMGGPSLQQFHFKDDHSPVYDYSRFDVDSPASLRRSVYRFIVRSVPDPFMEALDCPDANLLTPKRNVTLTPLQALSTLNDAFVVRQCEHFAARLRRESSDLPKQIERAYRLALSRPPRPDEAALLRAYAQKHGLANACRLLVNSSEFVFVE
jgi:hypothetical protein